MDLTIIHNQAKLLFNKRIEEANSFWRETSQDNIHYLVGTAHLIDGDSGILEKMVEERKHNDTILYNLYKYYENSTKKRNYYKNGLKNKNLFKETNRTLNKKIAIFLPHAVWTGGMKMIFNLGNLLTKKGYSVDYFIPYNSTGETYELNVGPVSVTVNTYENDLAIQTFSDKYDVAIATYWDLIFPLYKYFKKTIHFGQGDYNTFSNKPETIQLMKLFYSFPVHHMGVSSFMTDIMKKNYNRKSWIAPCSVNLEKFFYNKSSKREDYILVIGDASNIYKNTNETIENLIPIAEKFDTHIKWITPRQGEYNHNRVETIVNPSQTLLVKTMQKAKVVVNGSLIEAFSLPPLEAMACGTPVVASNNMGILQYAINGKNILLFPFKNYNLMREHVMSIYTNPDIEHSLIEEGLKTAKEYEDDVVNEMNFELIENEFLVERFIKAVL
ncbi:glycosyltransferase family 4 protein [Priestia aryabhattai]